MKTVTIIVPAFNEEENIPLVAQEIVKVAAVYSGKLNFEFLFLDNASVDRTGDLIKEFCRKDDRFKYIRMSRCFELDSSLVAGYRYASGNAIIVLYSDLQDPPAVIHKFIEKWLEGYDVVYGTRTVRTGDPSWRNALVRIAYKVISNLSDVAIPPNTGDFRLISSRVRDALLECPETNRYTRGLIAWLGFKQFSVEYEREPRLHGDSKANIFVMFSIALGAITSFSLKPLRLFTLFGLVILALCFMAALFFLAGFFFGITPEGFTTVIGLLLIAIGFNSLGIGILGEYLGRTYMEVKRRPNYVIQEKFNFESEEQSTFENVAAARDPLPAHDFQ